jgi:hypothetical protein
MSSELEKLHPQFAHSHPGADNIDYDTRYLPTEDPFKDAVEADKGDEDPAADKRSLKRSSFFRMPKFASMRSSQEDDTEVKEPKLYRHSSLRLPTLRRSSLRFSKEDTTEIKEDGTTVPKMKKNSSFPQLPNIRRFSLRSAKDYEAEAKNPKTVGSSVSKPSDIVARQALERAIGCPAQRVALMDSLIMEAPRGSEIIQQVYFCYSVQEFAQCEDAVEKNRKANEIVKVFVHNSKFPIQALQDPILRHKLARGRYRALLVMHKRFTTELSRNEEVMRMIYGYSSQ